MSRPLSLGTFEATREAAHEICRRYDGPRVLDVGCGRGDLLLSLAPFVARGCGVDISAEAIRTARSRAADIDHLDFQVAPVERLPPLSAAPFDVIFFVGSLEHMADPRTALAAVRARAHEDSRVVVVAISPGAPHAVVSRWMLKRSRNPVVAHLGGRNLPRVAEKADFQVEEVRPLYRGSRRGRFRRSLGAVLRVYDRLGGPTSAVVLRPARCPTGSDSSAP